MREAVDERNVKSGETTEIPISRSDSGVETLLDALRSDETIVAEASLDELEEQVNEVVYDLFDIAPEEQDVIEEVLRNIPGILRTRILWPR